jgi:hypothetical protein
LHGRILESLRRAQPAETTANYYDSMPIRHVSTSISHPRGSQYLYSTKLVLGDNPAARV